jgi:hypothetical protein
MKKQPFILSMHVGGNPQPLAFLYKEDDRNLPKGYVPEQDEPQCGFCGGNHDTPRVLFGGLDPAVGESQSVGLLDLIMRSGLSDGGDPFAVFGLSDAGQDMLSVGTAIHEAANRGGNDFADALLGALFGIRPDHDQIERELKNKVMAERYSNEQPDDSEPFLWMTHKGELVSPEDMATPHLFYALRMIFNHTCPEVFQTPPLSDSERVKGINRYGDVPKWTPAYCARAVRALTSELNERNPKGLLPGMEDQLRWMWIASTAMVGLGINRSAQ